MPMLMWCIFSWVDTTPLCESADWEKKRIGSSYQRGQRWLAQSSTLKLGYFLSSVSACKLTVVSDNCVHSPLHKLRGMQWFCYSGDLLQWGSCLMLLCAWLSSALPILATRVPQIARNSLRQVGQRELESHWTLSELNITLKLFFCCMQFSTQKRKNNLRRRNFQSWLLTSLLSTSQCDHTMNNVER